MSKYADSKRCSPHKETSLMHVDVSVQVSAFAPSFQGCGDIDVGDLTRIEFDNYSGEVQDFCVDQVCIERPRTLCKQRGLT